MSQRFRFKSKSASFHLRNIFFINITYTGKKKEFEKIQLYTNRIHEFKKMYLRVQRSLTESLMLYLQKKGKTWNSCSYWWLTVQNDFFLISCVCLFLFCTLLGTSIRSVRFSFWRASERDDVGDHRCGLSCAGWKQNSNKLKTSQ